MDPHHVGLHALALLRLECSRTSGRFQEAGNGESKEGLGKAAMVRRCRIVATALFGGAEPSLEKSYGSH